MTLPYKYFCWYTIQTHAYRTHTQRTHEHTKPYTCLKATFEAGCLVFVPIKQPAPAHNSGGEAHLKLTQQKRRKNNVIEIVKKKSSMAVLKFQERHFRVN